MSNYVNNPLSSIAEFTHLSDSSLYEILAFLRAEWRVSDGLATAGSLWVIAEDFHRGLAVQSLVEEQMYVIYAATKPQGTSQSQSVTSLLMGACRFEWGRLHGPDDGELEALPRPAAP